jgi:hypothetical protein
MHPRLRAWAQLVRVPNTLTACADILAGFSIVAGAWSQNNGMWPSMLALSVSSICLYWAGMVLNDVHDLEEDRAQRRKGPLVDQRISLAMATCVGWALLFGGVAMSGLAAYLVPAFDVGELGNDSGFNKWFVVGAGVLLALTIVAYDSRWKATAAGPFLMGLCRGLNLLMGVLLGASFAWPDSTLWMAVIVAVFGHICFVMGITLAARREAFLQQSTVRLKLAWGTSLVGVVAFATCSMFVSGQTLRLDPFGAYPFLVGLLSLPWLRRAFLSIRSPAIGTLVPAIKQAILSIIFFDAAMALQFAGNVPGLIVCGLAIPTLFLARVFRMT